MSGDGNGADEAPANVNVRVMNGHPFSLSVTLNSTVEEFRREISAIRDDRLLLIYNDRVMRDVGLTLQSYGVEDGVTVDVVVCSDASTAIANSAAGGNSLASSSTHPLPQPQPQMASRGQTSREAALSNGGTIPAEERYGTQLAQLEEMNFLDIQANIRALNAADGNLTAAVQDLLGLGSPNHED